LKDLWVYQKSIEPGLAKMIIGCKSVGNTKVLHHEKLSTVGQFPSFVLTSHKEGETAIK